MGPVQIIIPLACFALNVLVQLSSNRALPSMGVLKSEALGFIAGSMAVVVAGAYVYSVSSVALRDIIALMLCNLLLYASLAYCYFHFVNLAITARRTRLLRDLYLSGNGLTMEQILAQYSGRDMIDNRVGRLLGSGQLVLRDGRFYIGKPIVLWIVNIVLAMKLFVIGKRSEFD